AQEVVRVYLGGHREGRIGGDAQTIAEIDTDRTRNIHPDAGAHLPGRNDGRGGEVVVECRQRAGDVRHARTSPDIGREGSAGVDVVIGAGEEELDRAGVGEVIPDHI